MPDAAVHSDEELVERAKAGDRAAFRLIAERHGPALFRYARSLTAHREDAEDVLQEALLAALRTIAGFRGEASLRTWLFTILRHSAYRLNRRQSQAPQASGDLETLGRAAGWGGDDPETLVSLAEDRGRLERALRSLDADDREILLLRDVEGMSGEQASAVLGLSLAAMKSRLHRARLHLAAALRSGRQA
ncbi:MAG: sigma-70 family RNA polymerase sigma factor [Bryobacterales bacterium]|nr:sigma-70 family RNA polymerase sigma factor [Acidobacteriota bacterium]MCB9383427.1 sigma-70 family RNA polymerase sigma factor [Bryobacterales bacterium]